MNRKIVLGGYGIVLGIVLGVVYAVFATEIGLTHAQIVFWVVVWATGEALFSSFTYLNSTSSLLLPTRMDPVTAARMSSVAVAVATLFSVVAPWFFQEGTMPRPFYIRVPLAVAMAFVSSKLTLGLNRQMQEMGW